MSIEESEVVRELYVEPTKAHKKDEADVFSLALQKGGLKSSVMACVISSVLAGNDEYNLTFLSDKK